ncbi:MAG: ATP-dependent DNA helicase RecG [Candidatus Moraniibacteriota bacterium]|nr:MAG: ATP-dependent DNA helicase RecG [Candidatus Moranbacteria bacterium]
MPELSLTTRLDTFSTIKKAHWYGLKRLGIETIRDLLYHFPTRYEDYSVMTPIAELAPETKVTVEGVVTRLSAGKTWKKKLLLTEAVVEDRTGTLRAIWFNQRFVQTVLKEGQSVRLSGKVVRDRDGLIMQSPAFERTERSATHTGRLVPVYPETTGLTSKFLRWQIATIFQKLKMLPDPIGATILSELHLPDLRTALAYIHFPKLEKHVLLAEKRFAFEEMFFLQLKSLSIRRAAADGRARPITLDPALRQAFQAALGFTLTGAQEKAIAEILSDLSGTRPMNRLLNGDVGSGKTAVAMTAMYTAAESGFQSALLAPTEVLATQHAASFDRIFAPLGKNVALLTGSLSTLSGRSIGRAALVKAIVAGIPDIVIGTHAILEDRVRFHSLALVVVDEQHHFGVAQRARLQEKAFESEDGSDATVPHFLTMTATPIPRTLALTLFGNLDLSLLDEMPRERKPIITRIAVSDVARKKVYAFIEQEIGKGRQAFVILPLVETSKAMEEVKAATTEAERLKKEVFPHHRVGLLHGRMKAKEKEAIMHDFKEQKLDILVSTAVVEVGIDIPNATVMLIEGAERFGLSQLHQFRGRVGRGTEQSHCFLFPSDGQSPESARLQALEKEASGFALAEIDLKLRGPGAFLGTRQSGLPDIAMEHLSNMKLIQIAREKADVILKSDPTLADHPLLRKALQTFEERIHLE